MTSTAIRAMARGIMLLTYTPEQVDGEEACDGPYWRSACRIARAALRALRDVETGERRAMLTAMIEEGGDA